MTSVYRIRNDVDHYQYFLSSNNDEYWKLNMDCTPRLKEWIPPSVYIYKPKLLKGDFYNTSSSVLISSPKATEILRLQLEDAGELLPLPFENELFTLLNVTECINCLDYDKTKWIYSKSTNTKLMIEKYAFHPDRFSSGIFKIPETCVSEILTVSGLRDPKDEFKYIVESAGLQGLIFELIWEM